MVNLTRIYTRTGDQGSTRLGDNSSVAKTDPRLEAYGGVDEANAHLGAAVAAGGLPPRLVEICDLLRNELFDLGADFATPADPERPRLRIEQASVDRLERFCDELGEGLPALRSFILPGGTPAGAQLHIARTVVRRTERRAWACEDLSQLALAYLNRLSDLLFIMARVANGVEHETLWTPGTDRRPPDSSGGRRRNRPAAD